MIYIRNLQENLKLFEALASPIRLQIIEMLHNGNEMNINEISKRLNLTNSALTMHIQKLSACGLIRVQLSSKTRGMQKICSLTEDKLLIELVDKSNSEAFYETELDVGQYAEYSINPTCGLGNVYGQIGDFDSMQVFSFPERFGAQLVWYTDGFVTYRFPNMLLSNQTPKELQFSLELAGEAPGGVANFPSDITFRINKKIVGVYNCPGEMVDRRGRFTPDWWPSTFGQYGKMKLLSITQEGTFLDGFYASDVTINDLELEKQESLAFTIDCRSQSKNNGGVTLFGTQFGDYNQGIKCRLFYMENKKNG